MIDAKEVSGLADLSEAAYINFDPIPPGGWSADALKDQLAKSPDAWPQARRDEFVKHWKIVAYQPNTGNWLSGSGFSATVFERIDPQPGEPLHVVAMRGTEGDVLSQIVPDLLSSDLSDLVANGLAWHQILDMYNWWHQMTAPLGATFEAVTSVSISTGVGLARIAAGYTDVILGVTGAWQIVHGTSTVTGLGLISPTEKVDVTGHSLGGNLATAFSRLFSGNTANVLTINGAGYSSLGAASGNVDRVFAELRGQTAFDPSRILNLYGDRGLNVVTQDVQLGLKQPGAHQPVFLENNLPGNTVGHGAGQMAISLNLYEMYRRLEGPTAPTSPSAMVARYRPFLNAAANDDDLTFERTVDSMRRLLLGGVEGATVKGDMATFFSRLTSLEASPTFAALIGRVTLTAAAGHSSLPSDARTDFSSFLSLFTLSPMVIKATSETNAIMVEASLAANWGSLAEATARIEGDNLVIRVGSAASVQVLGFAGLGSAAAQSWSVRFGTGSSVSLATLLAAASPADALADRRDRFLAQQRAEFLALKWPAFENGSSISIAAASVTTKELQADSSGLTELPNYLVAPQSSGGGVRTVSMASSTSVPIRTTVSAGFADTVGGTQFRSIFDLGGSTLPSGSVPLYAPASSGGYGQSLIGYFIPTTGYSPAQTSPQDRVSGRQNVIGSSIRIVGTSVATQMLVTGSAGDDEFRSELSDEPAQFRGAIDAGVGNDYITLNSTSLQWPYGYGPVRVLSGTADWEPMWGAFHFSTFVDDYERGLGAWVDAGDGNDFVNGTDAADLIIGGRGSDWMDGAAGADTYLIGRDPGSVDRIADSAAFVLEDGSSPYQAPDSFNFGLFLDYGGSIDKLHRDTIEFDASIDRSRASYKWVPGTQSGNSTLELYQDGELFLQVTYAGDGSAGLAGSAGIERFVFSDGQVLSLAELRMALPEFTVIPPAAPELRQPLADITVNEDAALITIDLASAFADPQGQPLSYAVAAASGQSLPAWLQFNAATGTITGLPGNDDVGMLGLIVLATNASGLTTQDRFDITVTNVNDAPQLTGQPPGPVIVEEGATCVRAMDWFHDVDAGDTLSLSVAATDGSPLPPWVQLDLATKSLSAVPPLGALGSITVRVTATDTGGLSASTDLVIDVQASASRVLTGTAAADLLQGHSGNDSLDGGAGNDTLIGARGDDVYAVDSSLDMVIELANEGIDAVQSSVSFVLGSNLENLTLTGANAINGTGNSLDNVLVGNSANNALTGAAGNDTLDGGQGSDSLIGGAGNDTYVVDSTTDRVIESASAGADLVLSSVTWALGSNVENLTLTGTAAINATGNSLGNVLTGNSAANTLSGGTGADTMIGGIGDDTYVVNSASDVVTELADEGLDVVRSSVTLVLGENIESLMLTGVGNISGTGNALSNALLGNAGNNTLNGGAGADSMVGGAGNDTYVVDDAADVVTELANEGVDLVKSGVTYTLSVNTEDLTLTGTTAINGTGNELDNALTGNSANNVLIGGDGRDFLNGGAGIDTMFGGAGDDTYVVNVATDVVTELADEGVDLVQASVTLTLGANVENLLLTGAANRNGTGNALDNVITGNSGTNTLSGLAGNDTLVGGAGNDTLIGGAGNDTYVMGRGYGAELVQENDATAGNTDVMQFLSGVASDQIWFRQVSNDLEVSIIGTTDKVLVQNWYLGSQYRVEQFKTSDGKTLLDSKVQDLVSAMASFTPPAVGQTTLPASYQTSLLPIIATDWGP